MNELEFPNLKKSMLRTCKFQVTTLTLLFLIFPADIETENLSDDHSCEPKILKILVLEMM